MSISLVPEVSVVIPVFNGEGHIKNAIDSVIVQTFSNWELLIVDDGSTDNTISIINEGAQLDRRIKVLLRESGPKGAPVCRNLGIQSAQSGLVVFLDADDLLLPHCLEQRVQKMLDNQDLNFAIFSQQVISDSSTNSNSIFNLPITKRKELIRSFLSFRYPWQTTGPIWRLDFLKSLGGFDENYHRMEDPDLHLMALLATDRYACYYECPADSVYHIVQNKITVKDSFYLNVIADSLRFLTKSWEHLKAHPDLFQNQNTINQALESGFFLMLNYYFLAKYKILTADYVKIKSFLLLNSILSFKGRLKLSIIDAVYTSTSEIVRVLRLRGLVFRLLIR
jgi:glycosyltransferase involved in cell wall biosynthesis